MNPEKQTGVNPLEQYVLLAKSAKAAAAVELIKQCLEAQGVYVFGELLDMPNIEELKEGQFSTHYNLLNLFAFGTYSDYKTNKEQLPDMSPIQVKKLRHLTVVSMATKNKTLPYALLLQELDIKNVRELEDLIIEVIYADIIRGKLDQKNQQLEVDFAIGRDIRPESGAEIVTVLTDWCNNCESVLSGIETQVIKANLHHENCTKVKQQIEKEVANIEIQTLKSSQQQDLEEQMVTESRELASQSDKPVKKSSKTKGLRGSSKLFGKS